MWKHKLIYLFWKCKIQKRMRLSLLSSLNNRKHMRVPRKPSLIFSLNNRKRQDLKSCSVALCAITFQLQPCFPWNCAPLEKKNCPTIQNICFQAKKTAIFANLLVSFFDVCAISYFISLSVDINSTWLNNSPPFITILEPCYKTKYATYKMIWMSRHIPVYIYTHTFRFRVLFRLEIVVLY